MTQTSIRASVIIATRDHCAGLLRCLTAVAAERAADLEVIVVDDASTDETPAVLPRLEGLRLLRNELPLGLTAARNLGAEHARGGLLLFLSDASEPMPGALRELAAALASPAVALAWPAVVDAYGTPRPAALEVDVNGSDGSPTRLSSCPECLAVRADDLRLAGSFTPGYGAGGETVELALSLHAAGRGVAAAGRAVVRTGAPPPVPAVVQADERLLQERWAAVESRGAGLPAAPAGSPAPLVSIVIPAFNKWQYTFKCLMSVSRQTHGVPHEVIVVDNASSDDTAAALPLLEGIRFHRNEENLGFAKACNQGAAMARGRYLLFLNNDTEALPAWLEPLVWVAESDPAVAAVGSKLLFPDGTLQHAGVAVGWAEPLPISPFHLDYHQPAERSTEQLDLSAVTAACMLVRANVFRAVGGFDEGYVNGYEDVDLCFKLRERGLRVVYTPRSELYHHESVSDGRFRHVAHNTVRLHQRWVDRFDRYDRNRWAETPAAPPPARPPLSILVPTLNALGTVASCLEELRRLCVPGDEIIVCDGGSTDSTLQVARRIASRDPLRVKVLSSPAGVVEALRRGLALATCPTALVYQPLLSAPRGVLHEVQRLLAEGPSPLVAFAAGKQGASAAGALETLRTLAAKGASTFFSEGTASLEAAAAAAGMGKLRLLEVVVER